MTQFQGIEVNAFTAAYLAAVYFTETGDGDQPDADIEMDRDAVAEAVAACHDFCKAAAAELEIACNSVGYSEELAGHDFWLTRNGHGAGFWDRDELDHATAVRLTELAGLAGGVDTYAGDDGKLYFG